MFIILHSHLNFNTSKAKSDADAFFKFRSFYFNLINCFDLSSIECNCGSHDWSMHASYSRSYTFLGRRIKVRIQRIICNKCGKTHALLIEDMIPFSTLSYNEIKEGISDEYIIDEYHHLYLKNKYNDSTNYVDMCYMNIRMLFISFITT